MNYLLLKSSVDELRQLVRYHGARGLLYLENVTSPDPMPREGTVTLPTLESSDLILERLANGSATVHGPTVAGFPANGEQRPARIVPAASPLLTETGVIHVVDQVELPPTLDIGIAKLMRGGKAATMAELMRMAGYGWIAEGSDGPNTTALKKRRVDTHVFDRPSYTVLCPTDKAFARINLTRYLDDPAALRALVELHIIPADRPPKSALRDPGLFPSEGQPIRLEDERAYRTLLAESGDDYGSVSFRSMGGSTWLVGIRGARGTGARNDWATVIGFGRATPRFVPDDAIAVQRSADMIFGGGILLIDSVLVPCVRVELWR